jgi:hypothetical protein
MAGLLGTLGRTVLLDDAAYREWKERPNLFLRGIVLIVTVSLLAGVVSFVINVVNQVTPFNAVEVERDMEEWFGFQSEFLPFIDDPDAEEAIEAMYDVFLPMFRDLSRIDTPMGKGLTGFFNALGSWLSGALASLGRWLAYSALVLVCVKLLGGSAKLPHFLGTVSLYAIPGLLRILGAIPCVGWLFVLIGAIWSIVVYVKATSVVADLDSGRATVAVFAPIIVLLLLGFLVAFLFTIWLVILF